MNTRSTWLQAKNPMGESIDPFERAARGGGGIGVGARLPSVTPPVR